MENTVHVDARGGGLLVFISHSSGYWYIVVAWV